jgi:hypothetical protein
MVDKRREGESLEDYRARLYAEGLAVKRYLKGTIKEGTRVIVPQQSLAEAAEMGTSSDNNFTHKRFNFKKTKKKNAMQRASRKRNRKQGRK